MVYDYIIVGSGLFGSIFAHEATKRGKKCLILEKRKHFGGNIYCEKIEDINVHKYGPHIFHTNDDSIWAYINQFSEFNRFTYSPISIYNGKVYNLPFNMNTFNQIWGVVTPEEAKIKIQNQVKQSGIIVPKNLEEQAIFLVGNDIYEILIKGYTEKQWGRSASELPASIIKRLPIRFNYDNNYFNDKYQGIPIGGYNKIIEKLISNIEIKFDVDFIKDRDFWEEKGNKIVFTGAIDEFFGYQYGYLEYRSLDFKNEVLEVDNFQGNAGVNFANKEIPYTRITEHKHFEFGNQKHTVITKEYPSSWLPGMEPYYPVNDEKNNIKFKSYKDLGALQEKYIFGGRLAEYKYYDMHQIVASALKAIKTEFNLN